MSIAGDDAGRMTGRCMCGEVSYSFVGRPLITALCHCKQCQRQSGSAFSIVAGVPAEDFAIDGETRVFHDTGDSGRAVERHFCGCCGSPMFSLIGPLPGVVLVKAGTLDDAAALSPTIEVFCETSLPFPPPLQGTERFAGSNV